jgi:NAD(P)-dependent dehydrogenase (short-subunit alcohol dehydrogenase family)
MVAAQVGGSIVSVTSIEGTRAAPGYAAYAAAKAGVINYTKTAALELALHGIRVNALAPDITITEGLARGGAAGRRRALPPRGADGTRGSRRRDRGRGGVPRLGSRGLHHGPDDPRRRRHARGRRLVPPSSDRRLRTRSDD